MLSGIYPSILSASRKLSVPVLEHPAPITSSGAMLFIIIVTNQRYGKQEEKKNKNRKGLADVLNYLKLEMRRRLKYATYRCYFTSFTVLLWPVFL